MCSRRALWCFSASPRCCRTARCSLSASTGHISSGGGGAQQAHGMRFSHLWGGHFHLCERFNRTYSAFFHQVGDHDNDSSVLLPHHPPKVLEGGLERTLGCYISSGLVVTLKEKSTYLLVSCNQYCIDLPQAQGALLTQLIWLGSVSNTADRHK